MVMSGLRCLRTWRHCHECFCRGEFFPLPLRPALTLPQTFLLVVLTKTAVGNPGYRLPQKLGLSSIS